MKQWCKKYKGHNSRNALVMMLTCFSLVNKYVTWLLIGRNLLIYILVEVRVVHLLFIHALVKYEGKVAKKAYAKIEAKKEKDEGQVEIKCKSGKNHVNIVAGLFSIHLFNRSQSITTGKEKKDLLADFILLHFDFIQLVTWTVEILFSSWEKKQQEDFSFLNIHYLWIVISSFYWLRSAIFYA